MAGPKYCSDALRMSDQSCHDLKSFGLDLGESRASRSARFVCFTLEHDRTWTFGPGTAARLIHWRDLDWQPAPRCGLHPAGIYRFLEATALLPAQLCSGLKFELVLSSALVSGGATVLSYEIANARFERKVICYPTSCFDRLIPPLHLQARTDTTVFLAASLSVQHRPEFGMW
jgi:hypothetical protein